MSQHALASPSSAETWFNCAGSLAMQKGLPNDANDYSDHGTAAHLLGSTCLEKGTIPEEYRGRKIFVGTQDDFDGAIWYQGAPNQDKKFNVRREYIVGEEMVEAIGRYVDTVRKYAEGADLMLPEQRVSIEFLTGEKEAAGTADATIVHPRELCTTDLKYGMGVRVYASYLDPDGKRRGNKQLMIYTLAVREELDMTHGPFDRFRFVISQPRIDHLDEWDCTAAELDEFAEEVRGASARALFLHKLGAKPDDPEWVAEYLNPSEDACRWCKAKPTCPALAKFVIDAAGADFDAIDTAVVISVSANGPELLAQKMRAIPLIEDWCKAVRAKVESELFAGVAIPGWKIVQGKRGNRSWSDVEEADALLKKMRVRDHERYDMKLKSPPALEKVMKATPKRWARVVPLITQRDGQPSVAPASDKRPVWTPPDTSNDFTATAEEESLT